MRSSNEQSTMRLAATPDFSHQSSEAPKRLPTVSEMINEFPALCGQNPDLFKFKTAFEALIVKLEIQHLKYGRPEESRASVLQLCLKSANIKWDDQNMRDIWDIMLV